MAIGMIVFFLMVIPACWRGFANSVDYSKADLFQAMMLVLADMPASSAGTPC
jgi:hypothetical protein